MPQSDLSHQIWDMRAGRLLHLAWALFLTGAASGQFSNIPGFMATIPVQGLPPGDVAALSIDPQGMLWIGTGHGLCRYDGNNLDLFRHVPGDSTSLPNNSVRCLLQEPDGRLWVGGFGLSIRDPHSGRFHRVAACTQNGRVNNFECLQLWAGPDGTVWAACNTSGLMRYDPANDCLVPASGPDGPFTVNSFWAGVEGLWCTSRSSLILFDPRDGGREVYELATHAGPLPKGTLFTVVSRFDFDPDALWIGGWGLGLVRFDLRDRTFQGPFLWEQGEPTLTNIVYRMISWGNQGIMLSTNTGLRWFDPATRTFSPAMRGTGDGPGPEGHAMFDLLPTPDGAVWVGANGRLGLIPPQGTFRPLGKLSGNTVVVPDPAGAGYWACRYYHQRALMQLDSGMQEVRYWELPGADRDKYEPFNLLATGRNGVFIGTTHGLLRLAPGADRVQRVEGPWPGGRTYITSLMELPDGSVLFGTVAHGFWLWEPGSGAVRLVAPRPVQDGTEMNWATVHGLLDPGHVLVSFPGAGLGVLELGTAHLDLVPAGKAGLLFLDDLAAMVLSGDQLFAVTRTTGVARLRWNGPGAPIPFSLLGMARLPGQSDVFNDAAADDQGLVWIASTAGLLRYDPGANSFVRCGPIEGFPPGGVSRLVHDAPHHMLAMGAGVVGFDVRKAVVPRPPPGVYLRTGTVNGTGQDPFPITEGSPIILEYDHNTITLAYSAIDLVHADQLEYEVMLEGYDDGWLDNRGARTVTYVALAPGNYRFAVRVKGLDGPVVRQAILIRPAFWQTWWFKVLVWFSSALLVLAGTRYLVRLHYRRRIAEMEREQEVQRTRMRIAQDIHDGIGGGLTRIALLSRRIGQAGHEEVAASISKASTELVRELGEIVWTVDPKNDSRSAFIAYVRSTLSRQFDDLELHLVQDLRITPGEEQLAVPPDVKRNTVLILKEAVNNALKHAGATEITVRLYLDGGRLELEVADNGKGFDPVARDGTGNGLANLRKRSVAAGGKLELDAGPGRGTTVRFTCPLTPTFM